MTHRAGGSSVLSAGGLSQVEEEASWQVILVKATAQQSLTKQARVPLNLCLGCIDGSREDRSRGRAKGPG